MQLSNEPGAGVTPTVPSVSIDDKMVFSFVDGLSPSLKSDVLNSSLLAQLNSSVKYPDPADGSKDIQRFDVEGWYKNYQSVMSNVGWVFQDFTFTEHATSESEFELSKVLEEMLLSVWGFGDAKGIIDSLRHIGTTTPAAKVFQTNVVNDQAGKFSIGRCVESNGTARIDFGAVYVLSEQSTTDCLFFKYSSKDTKVYAGTSSMVLDLDIYGQVRDAIVQKLGTHAQSFVADLDIGI